MRKKGILKEFLLSTTVYIFVLVAVPSFCLAQVGSFKKGIIPPPVRQLKKHPVVRMPAKTMKISDISGPRFISVDSPIVNISVKIRRRDVTDLKESLQSRLTCYAEFEEAKVVFKRIKLFSEDVKIPKGQVGVEIRKSLNLSTASCGRWRWGDVPCLQHRDVVGLRIVATLEAGSEAYLEYRWGSILPMVWKIYRKETSSCMEVTVPKRYSRAHPLGGDWPKYTVHVDSGCIEQRLGRPQICTLKEKVEYSYEDQPVLKEYRISPSYLTVSGDFILSLELTAISFELECNDRIISRSIFFYRYLKHLNLKQRK